MAGKGGVKLPTVGASGSFWGQFGIWQRACPRLLDPIRQPCCLVCKANLENLQLSLCYKSAGMSTSIISNLCYKHGGNKLLNSACHSRRQGGHLGPVFIWIHTHSNNNTFDSECNVLNNSNAIFLMESSYLSICPTLPKKSITLSQIRQVRPPYDLYDLCPTSFHPKL